LPITRIVEKERNLTRLIAVGRISTHEMKRAIEAFWEEPELTLDVLWDYRDASLVDLTTVELRELVPVGKVYGHRLEERRGGRTAIVAPGDLEYGMMRVSEALSLMSEYTFEVNVFRTMGEAEIWLAEPRTDRPKSPPDQAT